MKAAVSAAARRCACSSFFLGACADCEYTILLGGYLPAFCKVSPLIICRITQTQPAPEYRLNQYVDLPISDRNHREIDIKYDLDLIPKYYYFLSMMDTGWQVIRFQQTSTSRQIDLHAMSIFNTTLFKVAMGGGVFVVITCKFAEENLQRKYLNR